MKRLLNIVVVSVIALSALALVILMGTALWDLRHGPVTGLLEKYAAQSAIVYPGWVLAVIKLLQHLFRGLRGSGADLRFCLLYLGFCIAPFMAQALVERRAGSALEVVAVSTTMAASTAEPPARNISQPMQPPLDTPGYSAGRQWALENKERFTGPADCQGEEDFQRGCLNYYKMNIIRGSNAGLTTNECQQIVNQIYWDYRGKGWRQQFEHCDQIDQNLAQAYIIAAYRRVDELLERLKAGGSVTEVEIAAVAHDVAQMPKFIDIPYKPAFLKLSEEFQTLAQGQRPLPQVEYPKLSCPEYKARLDELQKLEQQYVGEMQSLKRPDGVTVNGARHDELNQSRIELFNEAARYAKGAALAECDTHR